MNTEIKELHLDNLGTVKVKELTVGNVLQSQNLPEDEQVIFLVQKCLVEPKYTEKQIKDLPMRSLDDLGIIVEFATGTEKENEK